MVHPQSPATGPGPQRNRRSSVWPVVAAVSVGFWAVAVTLGTQSAGWLAGQILLAGGRAVPAWLWVLVGLGNALLVAVPAVLLATVPRRAAIRAAGRVWSLAALALGVLSPLRTVPMVHHELYLAGLTLTGALGAVVLHRLGRHESPTADRTATRPLAVAAGLALLLPWLWVGALGGAVETVLALTAAAVTGRLAGDLLDQGFWAAYRRRADGRVRGPLSRTLLSGLVAAVALLLLGAGIGQAGAQLAVLLVLPVIGLIIAGLVGPAAAGRAPVAPTRWLVALGSVGPLALVDPEEISLVLAADRDAPFWVAVAAIGALIVGVGLALGYGLSFARTEGRRPGRRVATVSAVLLLLTAGVVHLGPGQPGLHGERLFVIMKAEADLTGLPGGFGPDGRRIRAEEVYRRLVATAEQSQADLRRELARWHLPYTPYYLVNAVEVSAGPAVRAWLSRRPDVARVLVSQQLRPLPATPSVTTGELAATGDPEPAWNLTMIGADRVWSELGVDGSGIVVGGSDSGVDGRHPALAGGYRGGDDSWYDPWRGTRTPTDLGWHGTHTLATAVGAGGVGVAPGARWVGCVNLGRNLGNPARYLDCLQFMLAPFPAGGDPFTDGRPGRGPQVLTNSWGCPPVEGCDQGALRTATAALAAAGVFVVAAAGNTGPFCSSVADPPAPYADVFTVGAVDRQRRVTTFSSRGPTPDGLVKPDLVAPGAGVRSAMPGGGYATRDGTSMATPHVAGVVALMWSANPELIGDLDRTRRLLRETAAPALPSYRSSAAADACGQVGNITGAGLVDAYAAVRAAQR